MNHKATKYTKGKALKGQPLPDKCTKNGADTV
jgi:hypothetical protein